MRTVVRAGFGVLLLFAIGCGAGTRNAGVGSDPETPAAAAAKVGESARDGKFEFTVESVKCGVGKVGSDLLGAAAQGQFCLVTVKVSNIGNEAQSFSDSSQKAYGADGVEYSTDSSAAFYANEDAAALFKEINPGNSLTAVIVFDIPASASLARLELHDSPFSGGVAIQLG